MAHQLTFIEYIKDMHFDDYQRLNYLYQSHAGLVLAVNSECFKTAQEPEEEDLFEAKSQLNQLIQH